MKHKQSRQEHRVHQAVSLNLKPMAKYRNMPKGIQIHSIDNPGYPYKFKIYIPDQGGQYSSY